MVEMETFELWVSSEVPLIQGKKKRRRRRDLCRLVPQKRADRGLARQTAAEPEQHEAHPNTGQQQNRRKPSLARVRRCTSPRNSDGARNLSPARPPFARSQLCEHTLGKQHCRHSCLIVHLSSFKGKKCQIQRILGSGDRASIRR